MRYSIHDFNQEAALEFTATVERTVTRGGERITKPVTICLDATDLLILDWFLRFYPVAEKRTINGKEYAWIKRSKITEDLPILRISEKAASERLSKLCILGLLEHEFVKVGGSFSYYTFGGKFAQLLYKEDGEGRRSTSQGVGGQPTTPVDGQPTTKDKQLDNSYIKDRKKKTKKKVNQLAEAYTNNTTLRNVLLSFIEHRQELGKPLTERAMSLILGKLDKASNDRERIEMLEASIANGWTGVFPIREQGGTKKSPYVVDYSDAFSVI